MVWCTPPLVIGNRTQCLLSRLLLSGVDHWWLPPTVGIRLQLLVPLVVAWIWGPPSDRCGAFALWVPSVFRGPWVCRWGWGGMPSRRSCRRHKARPKPSQLGPCVLFQPSLHGRNGRKLVGVQFGLVPQLLGETGPLHRGGSGRSGTNASNIAGGPFESDPRCHWWRLASQERKDV